jgi:hypothetical protein
MPLNAARAETGGRPPVGFKETGGSSGSMISHSDSGTRGVGIPRRFGCRPFIDAHFACRTQLAFPKVVVLKRTAACFYLLLEI